jgi:prepilin-type N-terminal cleavage/methylation domain-containing protein
MKTSKGFTLIELMVSISILVTAVVGIYSAFSYTYLQIGNISSRLTAAYLAQEGLEIVRNLRDGNWISLENEWSESFSICSQGCQADYATGTPGEIIPLMPFPGEGYFLNIDEAGFYTYKTGANITPTKFKRKITINNFFSSDVVKVTSEVFWQDRNKEFSFKAKEYLYNWY